LFRSKYCNGLADDTLHYTQGEAFQYHVDNPNNLMMPYMGNCSGFFHIFAAGGEEAVKNNPYYTPGNVRVAEKMKELCSKYGCTVTQVVLGLYCHQPIPCVPLSVPAITAHAVDACGTLHVPFADADYAWLLA